MVRVTPTPHVRAYHDHGKRAYDPCCPLTLCGGDCHTGDPLEGGRPPDKNPRKDIQPACDREKPTEERRRSPRKLGSARGEPRGNGERISFLRFSLEDLLLKAIEPIDFACGSRPDV